MSTNGSQRLRECPFCGGDEIIRSVDGGIPPDHCEVTERYVTTCTLYCKKCGAQVQRFRASNSSTNGLYRAAVDECYKAWNTRHERTCHGEIINCTVFQCNECGFSVDLIDDCGFYTIFPPDGFGTEFDNNDKLRFLKYCPNCGAKVVNPWLTTNGS